MAGVSRRRDGDAAIGALLEEYHREKRGKQPGRNTDTVTRRRENGKERSREGHGRAWTAWYICDYTRRGYTMRHEGQRGRRGDEGGGDGGTKEEGSGGIAPYPIFFSIPRVCTTRFSFLSTSRRHGTGRFGNCSIVRSYFETVTFFRPFAT